jgi:SAM-dependent methyltransferase
MTNTIPCRLCRAPLPAEPAFCLDGIPQGAQALPSCEELASDHGVSVEIRQCPLCGLVQLNGPQIIYREGSTSATSFSRSMLEHRRKQAREFVKRFTLQGCKVLEVGCGDGHFLELLALEGALASGVEPSAKAAKAGMARGLKITNGYVSRSQPTEGQPYDAFVTIHVMEHVSDVTEFLQGIWSAMGPNAVGFIEVPSLEQILERSRFYDFMPDHLSYFSRDTLRLACENNGFAVIETGRDWEGEHDYAFVRKRELVDFGRFQLNARKIVDHFNAFLLDQVSAHRRVAVWGASHHANVLLSQVNHGGVEFVIDSATYKQGHCMPVSHLPIVSPSALRTKKIDTVLVIAPRFYKEILHCLLSEYRFPGCVAVMNRESIEVVQQIS